MKIFLIFLLIATPLAQANSLDVHKLRFYVTNYNIESKNESIIAYILKSDPCLIIKTIKNGKTNKYCDIAKSGINLEKDSPSAYILNLSISGATVYFTVAAPWNSQECMLIVGPNTLQCHSSTDNI